MADMNPIDPAQKANFVAYAGRVERNPADTAGKGSDVIVAIETEVDGIAKTINITTQDAQTLARLAVGSESKKAKPNGSKVMADTLEKVAKGETTMKDAIKEQMVEFAARDSFGGVKDGFKLDAAKVKAMGDAAADYDAIVKTAAENQKAIQAAIKQLPNADKFKTAARQEIAIVLGKNTDLAKLVADANTPEKAAAAIEEVVKKLPADIKKGLEAAPKVDPKTVDPKSKAQLEGFTIPTGVALAEGAATGTVPSKGGSKSVA